MKTLIAGTALVTNIPQFDIIDKKSHIVVAKEIPFVVKNSENPRFRKGEVFKKDLLMTKQIVEDFEKELTLLNTSKQVEFSLNVYIEERVVAGVNMSFLVYAQE